MNRKFLNWSIFILLCFIWGSSFILMKEGKDHLTAFQIGGLRIFSAGLIFLPVAIFALNKISRRKLGVLALTGFVGNLLPAFLFAAAIMKIDSLLEGILNCLTPICVVVIGWLVFGTRIRSRKILGVFIGFAGLCLLTFLKNDVSTANLGYSALVIVATISYGFNVNMASHYLKGINPVHMAAVSLVMMAIPAGLVLWQQGFFQLDFSSAAMQWSVLCSVLLGVVGSALATAIFYILVKNAGGLFASMVTYGIPFVALFWGSLDDEPVTWLEIACLGIILVGVFLTNFPEKKRKPADEAEK
ncbi:MAG TPA: DMT family transporter [Chitinophagaceae bacterium]|nr:DMT family transporter [Chitinophagaceae bacterium]